MPPAPAEANSEQALKQLASTFKADPLRSVSASEEELSSNRWGFPGPHGAPFLQQRMVLAVYPHCLIHNSLLMVLPR